VYLLFQAKQVPEAVDITMSYSDSDTPSDNFSVTLTTARGDLITLTFSSRSEPFEGVNETINYQQDDVIVKVDDHRRIWIWQDDKYYTKRYWPKNAGHKKAILQPFVGVQKRHWQELTASTRLMLEVTDMVNFLDNSRHFKLSPKIDRQET
jgi:hypothetical protein